MTVQIAQTKLNIHVAVTLMLVEEFLDLVTKKSLPEDILGCSLYPWSVN